MAAEKQSSARLSAVAGKYLNKSDDDLRALDQRQLFADLRSLAASVLSQDETPGSPRKTQ